MTDVHNKETRSYNMSMIKGKDTKPEIIVRKFLHRNGYRYRLNSNKLPGKPDIVLPRYRSVIFINGCFWHGHENCRYYVVPKTRTDWWLEKISATRKRDAIKSQELVNQGWKIKVIWECELEESKIDRTLGELLVFLDKN